MPINRRNTRDFHKRLYAGQLQSLWLVKRGPDQLQGQERKVLLFNCRRGQVTKTGQPVEGDFVAGSRVTWHIPRQELDRVGVEYISALDRFVDPTGETDRTSNVTWQPEAGTMITVKLFGNHVCVDCLRTDPVEI